MISCLIIVFLCSEWKTVLTSANPCLIQSVIGLFSVSISVNPRFQFSVY